MAAELIDSNLTRMLKLPLLTAAQERVLLTRAKAGDRRARDTIVRRNLRLVYKIAGRWRGRGVPLDDLISEGVIGLCRAIEKFDVSRRLRFTTYATWWVTHTIDRAVRDKGRMIRLPAHIGERTGRDPTGSLDTPVGTEGGSAVTIGDLIPGDDVDVIGRLEREETVRRALSVLTRRERVVIVGRFGLDGPAQRLEDIGERLGLTRERVRQIQNLAIEKIRAKLGGGL